MRSINTCIAAVRRSAAGASESAASSRKSLISPRQDAGVRLIFSNSEA